MTDRLLLILTAIASSFAAWAFWHYLDKNALDVMLMIALICTIADNWRLRRALRQSDKESSKP